MYKLNPLEKFVMAATLAASTIACGGNPEKNIKDYHAFKPMNGEITMQNPRGETAKYTVTVQSYDASRDFDTPQLRWKVDIKATSEDAAPQLIHLDGPQPSGTNPAYDFDHGLISYKVGGKCEWYPGIDTDEDCEEAQKENAKNAARLAIEATLKQNGAK